MADSDRCCSPCSALIATAASMISSRRRLPTSPRAISHPTVLDRSVYRSYRLIGLVINPDREKQAKCAGGSDRRARSIRLRFGFATDDRLLRIILVGQRRLGGRLGGADDAAVGQDDAEQGGAGLVQEVAAGLAVLAGVHEEENGQHSQHRKALLGSGSELEQPRGALQFAGAFLVDMPQRDGQAGEGQRQR